MALFFCRSPLNKHLLLVFKLMLPTSFLNNDQTLLSPWGDERVENNGLAHAGVQHERKGQGSSGSKTMIRNKKQETGSKI